MCNIDFNKVLRLAQHDTWAAIVAAADSKNVMLLADELDKNNEIDVLMVQHIYNTDIYHIILKCFERENYVRAIINEIINLD